jgi:2-keto-4-pentenoate hydratase/2-oxohepta-3-ene-1,7-dioic acid hydratase in catechol pathway
VGLNYRDHVVETGRALPEHPDIFAKFATSLTGPTDDLCLSAVSLKLDYEGELAVVIGTPCRRVSPEAAIDSLAGAMILNDTTARDLQFNGTQWLPGKAVDSSTPCGPALVTLDELGDPHDLDLVTRLNGVEVQRAHTDRMVFTIPQIISYISQFLELAPGDVITTGTPEGVGSRKDPPSFLGAGDVVEVEIDASASCGTRSDRPDLSPIDSKPPKNQRGPLT